MPGPTRRQAAMGLASGLAAAALARPAAAREMLGIAASAPGSVFHSAGTAIAQVANREAGLKMTVQAFASPNVYLPAVASGQIAFGVSNAGDVQLASTGELHFAGRRLPDLRAAAVLFPLRMAVYVRRNAPYESLADLRGAKMPTGFASQATIVPLFDAVLATAGMTLDDIGEVRVPNIVTGANQFMEGNADAFFFALGAAKVREADAAVGGIRALDMGGADAEASLAAIQRHWPAGYLDRVEPGPANTGVADPILTITHDAMVLTGAATPDAQVHALVSALHGNAAALAGAFGPFRLFDPAAMTAQIEGVQWHPGALDFYRSRNVGG